MMRRKSMLFTLITLFTVLFLAGCKQNVGTPEDNAVVEESEEEKETEGHVFGFSGSDLSDPFYEVLKDSVEMSVGENDRMLVRDARGDSELQISQIRELIDQGVEAVFICPVDPEAITPALETLSEAKIPVVNLDVRVEETELTDAFIGADDYNAGKVCGEDLLDRRPEGGKIVIIERPESAVINERITGFEKIIANGGFEVERIDMTDDYSVIPDELTKIFKNGPIPDAIMCGDDQMAEQVLKALDDMSQTDTLVYSVGGSPAVKKELADPFSPMTGVGAKSPINMGKTAVQTATAILEDGAYEQEIYVETFFINKEDVDMYGTDGWQ